ncbi:hypothetical protein CLAFUW4_09600 [Fulvia fulva]|uniref:Lipocalin-like domain-containing protein n=1 Tax=Passalora fulva TaxID=5499 RepID=A0A9Q8UTL3_PASFU|nr:uncharacterized protein CLAFUR5_09694 [Fulvia fulva]KAK4614152.1 hypothetical protein CLAFUR4_09605 [Fulvia fulva]KAK4614871.1 hypothetical protein CLAFUR0_09596 [Fulvia fulva]UJO21938.1 hypothetical protein CLAFUR5_09694 [Fulvia fulva]WPV20595.1 hypothetical protein CLAFUW4_09600 [Fulvia fulva]WPV35761.1 hypothetical protein CLAFUW7_09601 [Fulvia fulva]
MLVATMPQTQYLQVPKALPGRRSRSRSRTSRTREPSPVEVYSPDRVVVSPMKLSFSSVPIRSPSPDRQSFKPEPYRKPSFTNGHYNKMATTSWSEKPRRIASCPVPSLELEDAPMTGTNYDDLNEGLYTMEQCVTPPPEPPLKERLVGAWKLESYIAYPTPVSPVQRPTFPMTKNVTGFIMYTPDGYMSAQMLIPGQQSFKRGEGEEPQWAEAGKRCFAYCGPYYISNEGLGREEILRHTFQCCSLPGWIGDIQIRTHRFEEDGQVLVLGSEEPTEVKGDKRIPVLKWRRARDNSNGVPPPPTPQIKVSGPGEP